MDARLAPISRLRALLIDEDWAAPSLEAIFGRHANPKRVVSAGLDVYWHTKLHVSRVNAFREPEHPQLPFQAAGVKDDIFESDVAERDI